MRRLIEAVGRGDGADAHRLEQDIVAAVARHWPDQAVWAQAFFFTP
ncbi:MAG: hypothetical protein ACK559_09040 [bacterium]